MAAHEEPSEVHGEPSAAHRGDCLLRLARAALMEHFEASDAWKQELYRCDAPWLREPGATFVTLRRVGELRGCIGHLEARRPLGEDLRENAVGAATRDPRFRPVARFELPELRIEVSKLGPLTPVDGAGEAAVLDRLRPRRDGVLLVWRDRRATFLPQVWEQLPEPRAFLGQLKRKAGLGESFWHRDLEIWRYDVEKWAE